MRGIRRTNTPRQKQWQFNRTCNCFGLAHKTKLDLVMGLNQDFKDKKRLKNSSNYTNVPIVDKMTIGVPIELEQSTFCRQTFLTISFGPGKSDKIGTDLRSEFMILYESQVFYCLLSDEGSLSCDQVGRHSRFLPTIPI